MTKAEAVELFIMVTNIRAWSDGINPHRLETNWLKKELQDAKTQ